MATAQVVNQASDTDCSSVSHDPCAVFEGEGQPGNREEEVGALPTDLALAELVNDRALLVKEHTCCVCEDVAATAFCLHCRDMLCASCANVHGKLSVSKHHKVVDLSSLVPDALADNRPPACSSHPDELCELFCLTHGLCVCALCVAARHKSCPDLADLKVRTEEARVALANMAASLSASESELQRAIQQLDRHVLDTEERVRDTVANIQKTCDRLESGVRNCRGRMADLARVAASEIKDRTRAAITILQERKRKVTAHTAVVQRAKEITAPVAISDMHSLMHTRVPTLDCSVTLPASVEVLSTLTFVIDDEAVSGVERALGELGRIRLIPADHLAVFPQFAFHAEREANIILSNSSLTATLKTVGVKGIVRSRDLMAADVKYEVRLDQCDAVCWMAVGVLPERVTVSPWSQQLLHATLVSPRRVKFFGADDWVEHPVASAMSGLRQGDRVGVSVDRSCQLHLHVNGEDQGVWAKAVTGPCHALIVLGNKSQKQVTALPPTRLDR